MIPPHHNDKNQQTPPDPAESNVLGEERPQEAEGSEDHGNAKGTDELEGAQRSGRKHRRRSRSMLGPTENTVVVGLGLDPYELQEQMRAAGCTELERQAVSLLLVRREVATVAAELGVSHGKLAIMIGSACAKLSDWRRTHAPGLSHGQILAVYAAEMNRLGYRGEHHCRPGEEQCAQDGLCKRRWYLFHEENL